MEVKKILFTSILFFILMDSCASAGEVPDYTMKINFSNVTGSTIIDEAGGASGTLFNVARTQLPSGAFYGTFGGNSSSYVDLTNREDLDFGSNFTIEAWIRPEIPNEHGAILAKGSGQAGYQYMLSDTGNICAPFANFTNSGWVYCGSQSSLDNNSWYQVVWTVETNNTEGFPQHNRAYIYVNMDRSLPTTTDGQILGSNSYNAYLGKGGYGNYKGDILILRVYRRMLSPAEIYQNYVATAPLVMPEVKIENSSYMFENGAGSQNINITLDSEAVNTVSYVDVRTFDGTANSSDYNTDNNSNSGLIAAIGDSITEASDVYYNNAHGYVGYLSQNLSAADNWTIINYGVGGYTTNNILSEYYSYVQPYHPSYGILLIGTNDIFRDVKSATYVENNIETIVGRMVEDNVTPILTTIPPSNTRTIETNNTMTTVNAWIRDYAAINGYHYVDLYALLADPNNPDLMMDDMTTDGLHLSALGCEVWSSAINPEWFKNDRRRVYFFPGDTLATFNTEILNNPESGNKTFKVDLFTPSGVYFSGVQESSVTIVDPVQNTTPSITWNSPADITYGTALSSTQLDAVATDPVTGNNVPGNLVYTPPAGTLLDVGTHTLHVDFTPDNSANYTTASKDVIINVIDQATPSGEVPGYTMMINFSNVTGSTIIDEAGGASGTLFNVARTQLPSGAYYGTFGGNSSSYVDLTNREDLDFGSNFTIEAWIRPDIPNGYGAIMAKGSGQAGYQYMLSDTGNICTPYANFTNSGWVYCGSQSILDNNSWYQVVWTVETNSTEGFPQHNRAYIYVNMDRSLPSTTNGQIVGSSSYNAYLGKGGYGNYKGDILFVRVYRKMLSPAEIYQNYVATAPLVMPEVKIENSSYMFENGAGSQNINITLDGEAVNTVSYVDVRAFGGTANSSDYNTDNNSNSGLIAAIGDSITEGSNVYYNNAHGYVGYLSQNLSAVDNWTIINYGVGGYTTDNVLSEYNSYVHPYHPSYGILLIGTNDIFRDVKSATYVENNIEIIVGRMVEDNVTPILTTIPPSSTSTVETNSTLTAVNAWIRNYAATNGYYCVDLYSLLADPIDPSTMKADMTTDGIHLSQLGYQVWSNAINPEWFKNDRRRVYFFPGDTLATFNTEILNNPGSGNKTFKVDLFTPSGVYFPGVQESTITINESKAIPLITWDNPANITYGTTLSSTQLNAVATDPVTGNNVPGNFVYTPYAGTLLGVGTHTLQVDFTPDDSANYTTASKTVTINVSKTAPIITWSTPANITYGTALNSSQLNAVASVSGTFVYTPSAGTVLDVGTHTLHVDFTPADTINYTTATADVTINVSERTKATPEITWSDPADITYGTALNEAQLNALASVPGSFVYSPAYGTILGAGTQTLQTTFTPADSVNYTTATGSVSLTVNKATPLITWSNPDAISYGTALSSTQLNAVASVPGSFVYSPASGTVLSAGTHDLQANFTPADAANYTTALKTVTINVSKTDPIITWSNPDDITYGTALSDTQLNAVASVPGTFVYTPSAGTVLNSGIQTLSINFTPADSANYTTASKSVTINISKAIPSITWSNPANVAYGTALSGTQLNAVSSVPGSFVYNPASGTVLGAGTQTLQTTFTPADSANYTTASKTVTISISKTLPSITWSSPADITYGTALNEAQLNALASVPGSFVYSPAYGTILGAGTQTLQTTFTPADSVNYTTATGSVSLTVNKATPLITWSNPDAISYGTALSSTQLNAVASVPGSFVYSPASGTVLSAGTHDLQANFTPTDAANYTNITAIVTINVLSQPILPVADFNASVFSGYAPLSVLFTDRSQNTTSWSWDFGDGATSVKQNPKHVYSSAGIYTVRLTAVNANGTDLKTATITVDKKTRGKSSNSNNNGGSPEFAKNIEVKELSQAFIVKGKTVQFDFTKNATCVVYVGFDAKKTVSGKTATIAEQLKNKSTLVSGLPEGEVYNYFNVWVGNSEFATSNNIENPVLCFKVEKSWIQDKNIDRDSIILNRYSNRAWEKLSTSFSGEDDKYLYFESNVPGYSFFAITWKSDAFLEETVIDIQPGDSSEENKKETGSEIDLESNEKKESPGMPGFDMVYGIAGLLVVLLYKKIKVY